MKLLLRQNGRRVFNCAGWLAGWRDAPVKRLSLLRACYGSAAKYCDDRVCLSVCPSASASVQLHVRSSPAAAPVSLAFQPSLAPASKSCWRWLLRYIDQYWGSSLGSVQVGQLLEFVVEMATKFVVKHHLL